MERRKALIQFTAWGLNTAASLTLPFTTRANEEVAEESTSSSIIPLAKLEDLPDHPLEAAQTLVFQRSPIYYPEVSTNHPLRSAIQSEVETRLEHIAARYNFDPRQLKRIAWCESGFYPNSINWNYSVITQNQRDNPTGTWQFLKSTFFRFLGLNTDYRRDLDVETLVFIYAHRLSPREWSCR